jgi:hypothetical protein
MADLFRLLGRLQPEEDGETPVRHRSGVVDAVNGDGTVDVEISGVAVTDVAVLDGAVAGVGDVVHVLTWGGDMLVLGKAAT